jgi:hypothetical protein
MNTFLPIQIIFLIFLIFAASRTILRVKEGNISFGSFLFWVSLWILATFSILRPEFTSYLAKQIGIGRGTDAVIYASIILLFYLIFRTNVMIENLRHEISKIVTMIALQGEKKKKK